MSVTLTRSTEVSTNYTNSFGSYSADILLAEGAFNFATLQFLVKASSSVTNEINCKTKINDLATLRNICDFLADLASDLTEVIATAEKNMTQV